MPYSSSVILYSSDFISHLSHLALQIFFFCQAYILIPNHLSVSSHNRLTLNERNCTYYEVSKLYKNSHQMSFKSKLSLCFYAPSKLSEIDLSFLKSLFYFIFILFFCIKKKIVLFPLQDCA